MSPGSIPLLRPLCLALAGMSLWGCINPHGIRMAEVDPAGWKPALAAEVPWENGDTLRERQIDVVVRLYNDFDYDRLGLALTVVSPDGYRWCDTLSVPVQRPLGQGGLYTEQQQPYRRGVVFPRRGRYLFSLRPVMPDSPQGVQGVAAVGIHIHD